ncbi:PAS/PAC sensor hybrid histidine kinase [Trichormus variabilis ATCC 29413]|uniref:Circadian input-output histidine kinase CikA n=2 Tax=Anabaena variabilis TaxID=264691 RepID=Q3M4Q6_TRIV2|nr:MULTISPECIES: PAS domain S-box protein [Nostocaceae]ABA24030.1 PAS/PAC sensor hybrid histidine kinase [Trichormus variabilis ATCC 29413]MBC1213224.1 PAS domain S-box protein [Trichormus variabilis ARAD]MBC1256170.1 PAS domain S-box protein [Trichormus variabilis V5]MBC1267369.1 PAS domain S-box protein [Trichormus variabilis FSR]MBC1300705.1 PAS domain S-box protein [Trichormus variabilis N2B]
MSSQLDQCNRLLWEKCPVGLVLWRKNGALIDVNPTYATILGRTVPETLNLNYWQITPENYLASERTILEQLEQTGCHQAYEQEYLHKDGHLVPVKVSTVMIEKDGEKLMWSSVEDISNIRQTQKERQQSEKILKQSEARYRSLVTTNTQIIWVSSPEGICFELKDWIAYTGQTLAEAENGGWIDAVHPDDRGYTGEAWGIAVANRSQYQIEYRIRGKDGNYRYFWVWGAPVIEEDGNVREWIGTCTDIHDRKLAEAENQRLKERYRSLVTASSQIVWGTTPEGWGISSEMLTWIAYTGQNEAEVEGWGWLDPIHPDDRTRSLEAWNAAVANRSIYQTEYQLRGKDGTYRYFSVCGVPVLKQDGSIQEWIGTCTDIHDRKLAEMALRQLNQQLEARVAERTAALQNTLAEAQGLNAILDNLADGLLVVDTTGQITHYNPAFLAMHGLTANTLNGHYQELPIFGLADLIEHTRSHPGEVFTADVALAKDRIGQAVGTAIFKRTDTQEVAACFGSALLIRDVTAEKEIDKMKTDFISTVSHELRTPLTSVLGFASIIQEKLQKDVFPILSTEDRKLQKTIKRVGDNLNIIVSEAERLTSLINDVLDIAKMEAGKVEWQMQPIDPGELLDWATTSTAALFETNGLQLLTEIESGLPQIIGDRNRLLQVLINLISNAVKFTEFGSVTCRVKQDKDGVCISVIDTGVGIAPEDQPKVFEKFRQVGDTLTDKPKGTGLGLPICKQIVEHHGGRIWVESEPGHGSVFSFHIPIYASNHNTNANLNLDALVRQLKEHVITANQVCSENRKTILVVDDDANIRELLRQQLENEGYNVREAKDGMDAIHQIKISSPDLIVLDVMMPQINGFDVAAVLKNDPLTADIPIIILSIVENKERGHHIGIDRYLTKPINTEELLNEIGSLLSQGISSKKVLVVDQNASTLKTISDVLQTQGYNVIEASDPQECIRKALSAKPDMIIIDSIFSQEADLVKTLKFEKELENVFFIMLSDR